MTIEIVSGKFFMMKLEEMKQSKRRYAIKTKVMEDESKNQM